MRFLGKKTQFNVFLGKICLFHIFFVTLQAEIVFIFVKYDKIMNIKTLLKTLVLLIAVFASTACQTRDLNTRVSFQTGLKNFDSINKRAELFISIGNSEFLSTPSSKGGYGTDAVKTLVNYCFNHLNIHKISLNVFASNKRAIRCYEKAGFVQEGLLKQHHFSNGAYEDVYVMAIISKS